MHYQNGSVHPMNFLLAVHKKLITNQKSMHTQQTAILISYKFSFQITGNIIMKMPLRKIILYNYTRIYVNCQLFYNSISFSKYVEYIYILLTFLFVACSKAFLYNSNCVLYLFIKLSSSLFST